MTLYWIGRQVSKRTLMPMMTTQKQKEVLLIEQLLDELEKSGVNIAELKKLYERGQQADALKESLIKLYQAHKFATGVCRQG